MAGKVIAVSGIDTDIGKTWATGLLAKTLMQSGKRIMTQKMVQTGCKDVAADIRTHRELMDIPCKKRTRMAPPVHRSTAIQLHLTWPLKLTDAPSSLS